jgi:hypothetical protein
MIVENHPLQIVPLHKPPFERQILQQAATGHIADVA